MAIEITTDSRSDVIDITENVSEALPPDLDRGVCTLFVTHTTAGVIVNEREPRLLSDIEQLLQQLIPATEQFEHDAIDDNAAAHLRSILLGESVPVPVTDGKLALGTWQSILFVESDGPRTRTVDIVCTSGI